MIKDGNAGETILPKSPLREAREALMWTMEEVAEKIGVSETSIGRWERGDKRPRRIHQRQLAELFATSSEALGFPAEKREAPAQMEWAVPLRPATAIIDPLLPRRPTNFLGRDDLLHHL